MGLGVAVWQRHSRLVALLVALSLLAGTRLPLATEYLGHFDAINFAFAIERFQPLLHQPQPPGYPLSVLLLKGLARLTGNPESALILSGVPVGAVALWFAWLLARRLFGDSAALYATALLLFHPVCWLAGVRNPVRLCLAAGACVVAYAAWRAWNSGPSLGWLCATAASLALASGFRPELLLMLSPTVLAAGIRSRCRFSQLACAGALMAALCCLWLWPLLEAFGGIRMAAFVMWHYAREQFQGSSALMGARAAYALKMALMALVWTGGGALAWVWALPWARHALKRSLAGETGLFLGTWLAPPLAFHCLVHIGEPEHALVTIPALCLVGGAVLSHWSQGAAPMKKWIAAGLAAGLSSALFFVPGLLPGTSYWVAAKTSRQVAAVVAPLKRLRESGPTFVLSWESAGLWRQVSYYLASVPVLILHGTPEQPGNPARHMYYLNRQRSNPPEGLRIIVPPAARVAVIFPQASAPVIANQQAGLFKREGALVYVEPGSGAPVRIGAYELQWATTSSLPPSQPSWQRAPAGLAGRWVEPDPRAGK